jgi:hypothetical protein
LRKNLQDRFESLENAIARREAERNEPSAEECLAKFFAEYEGQTPQEVAEQFKQNQGGSISNADNRMLLRAVIEKANLDLTGFKDHYEASHYALEALRK